MDMHMTTVFCTFEQAAFHNWKDAPPEHRYLASPHRHVFRVRVDVRVTHDNRDVEIIWLKDISKDLFLGLAEAEPLYEHPNFGSMSCEMMACGLAKELEDQNIKIVSVEVSEDGENGARIYR